MNLSKKILIIEDDKVIAEQIKKALQDWGYEAFFIMDFKDVITQVKTIDPHLILLDVNLPNKSGFALCQQIRLFSQVPIVFISSCDDDMKAIMAMNSGGDDYITKPFDLSLLVAKVQAILRRTYEFGEKKNECLGDIEIDFDRYIMTSKGVKEELTKNESIILKTLYQCSPRVVSRDQLMNALWDNNSFIDDNALNVNITRLRKKLKLLSDHELLKTKKGVGYYLCDE